MELRGTTSVIVASLCLLQSYLISGCQCGPKNHPQEQFCSSDYVIIGRVVEKMYEYEEASPFEYYNFFPIPHPNQHSNQNQEDPEYMTVLPMDDIIDLDLPFLQRVRAPPTETPIQQFPFPPLMVHDDPQRLAPMLPRRQKSLKYIVDIEKVFRSEGRILKSTKATIYTEPAQASCGITHLSVGKKYLIAGSIQDDKLHIHQCDWVEASQLLTKSIRRGLRHFYGKYCDKCEIQTGVYFAPNSRMKPICAYNPFPPERDCEGRFSSCIKRPNGSCGWYKGKDYKMCKKGVQPPNQERTR